MVLKVSQLVLIDTPYLHLTDSLDKFDRTLNCLLYSNRYHRQSRLVLTYSYLLLLCQSRHLTNQLVHIHHNHHKRPHQSLPVAFCETTQHDQGQTATIISQTCSFCGQAHSPPLASLAPVLPCHISSLFYRCPLVCSGNASQSVVLSAHSQLVAWLAQLQRLGSRFAL